MPTPHQRVGEYVLEHRLGAGAFGAMLITLATVSWQAVRAASMDPVESLRVE